MNAPAEIDTRLDRIEALRAERDEKRGEIKGLRDQVKDLDEQIEEALDEIRAIRTGGEPVQETLGGALGQKVVKLDQMLKEHGASMTLKRDDGIDVTLGKGSRVTRRRKDLDGDDD